VPGMFADSMIFGVEATMVAVTTDAARGVTDRFRAMPMARSAVVAGRATADMLNSALGLLVRNPEAVVAVQVLVWPIGFLSNAIAPTATMPG
jgi:ABC-2 type transport system permease protein